MASKFHIIARKGEAAVEVTLTKSNVITQLAHGVFLCNVYKSADHSVSMIEEIKPVPVETLESITSEE